MNQKYMADEYFLSGEFVGDIGDIAEEAMDRMMENNEDLTRAGAMAGIRHQVISEIESRK